VLTARLLVRCGFAVRHGSCLNLPRPPPSSPRLHLAGSPAAAESYSRRVRLSATEDANRRLLRARDAIDRHIAEPLAIPALARVALMSPAHFIREFRATFGKPPHRYKKLLFSGSFL
jgi:methylphosphotriester-DNA--protein-cysteine methyltransferase